MALDYDNPANTDFQDGRTHFQPIMRKQPYVAHKTVTYELKDQHQQSHFQINLTPPTSTSLSHLNPNGSKAYYMFMNGPTT